MSYRRLPFLLGLVPALVLGLYAQTQQPAQEQARQRWNRIFSSPEARFNPQPNAFLAEVIRGRRPGAALDLGMGAGRNALFLAQQGWEVTGVDISDVAVAQARERAKKLGVKLNAVLQDADEFDFGKERWDLVLVSYFRVRGYVPKIYESLKPAGVVVVEHFHRESGAINEQGQPIGHDSNELLKLFLEFRILRYEDVSGKPDWSDREGRVVRLLAQKP